MNHGLQIYPAVNVQLSSVVSRCKQIFVVVVFFGFFFFFWFLHTEPLQVGKVSVVLSLSSHGFCTFGTFISDNHQAFFS